MLCFSKGLTTTVQLNKMSSMEHGSATSRPFRKITKDWLVDQPTIQLTDQPTTDRQTGSKGSHTHINLNINKVFVIVHHYFISFILFFDAQYHLCKSPFPSLNSKCNPQDVRSSVEWGSYIVYYESIGVILSHGWLCRVLNILFFSFKFWIFLNSTVYAAGDRSDI